MKTRTAIEWQEEISNALEYRDKYAMEFSWQRAEDSYMNTPEGDTALGPNLIYSEGDTLLSNLTVPHPEIVVTPDEVHAISSAPIVQSLIKSLIKPEKLNLKNHVEAVCQNSYLFDKALLKIGYDSEFGWNPEFDAGTLQIPWGLSFTQFDKQGHLLEFNRGKPGMPWVSPVLPHDLVVPWGTGSDIETAPWIAFRFIRENSYFKKDPKFKNTSRLEPQMSMEDYMHSYEHRRKKYRVQYSNTSQYKANNRAIFNEAWEIHDKRTGRIIVITFDHDKLIRDDVNSLMLAIGGYPLVTSSFVKHTRSFWATPLSYYLSQHQADQFDLALQASKQRRLNVLKFLMMEGAMTKDESDKLMSGDVGAVAIVKKAFAKSLKDVFMPFPKGTNLDLFGESEAIRRHVREVMGNSSNQAGEFDSSSRRTATETLSVQSGSRTRLIRKEDVVRYLYCETMRKVMLVIFKYWSRPRDILVGDKWMKYSGDSLKGMYSYTCDLTERRVLSVAQRKMEAIQMLSFFAQFPNINLGRIEQYVMDAAADPAFPGFFQQAQPPQAGPQLPRNASAAGGLGQAQLPTGGTT